MRPRAPTWLIAGALALGIALHAMPADAQADGVSYSIWSRSAHRVTLRFLLPVSDANRVAGTDIDVLTVSRFSDYLLSHVAVRADGQDCPALDQGYDIGKVDPLTVGAGLDGFEIFFECPRTANIVLENRALFGRLPGEVNFARIQVDGGAFVQQLFTAAQERLALPSAGAPSPAGIGRYVWLGARDVLSHLDHLFFLVGVLLWMRRPRQLWRLIGALAAGYFAALPFSLLGLVTPRTALLEAFTGLLIALLAAQQVARRLEQPQRLAVGMAVALLSLAVLAVIAHAHWSVWLLVGAALFAGGLLSLHGQTEQSRGTLLLGLLFGFLDGGVLPARLLPLQLPGRTQWPMLAGFDVGAVLVAALVLLGLLALLAAANALRGPRWQPPGLSRALLRDLVTASLGGIGLFWLVTGLHG